MLVQLGAVDPAAAVAAVPAQDPPPPPQGEDFGKASPVALVVVILLAIATAVLIRSMSKRIKKLPESFERTAGEKQPGSDEERSSS
ncbi:MAG: hypothetical protein JWP64_1702 [Pseudonocardia sp.]|jgi:hypothetical protein|uniref:hypothetical protein n=1 Tax=Pseudonocardia sp. TaxID=60912 RepID=UPI002608D8B2|nr:hypothetical protein [Pseudonocardia sp.]MCU1626753.1 hypothetical protein [Pseudonocardia sp.]MDT7701628.1 hypothetical protein [Pseudonocardiales bacterium]